MVIPSLHFPLHSLMLLPAARRNRWSNRPPPLHRVDPCCYPAPYAVVIHIIRQINGQCSILEEEELHQGKTRIPIYLPQEMGYFCIIAKNCGQEMKSNYSPGREGATGGSLPGLFGVQLRGVCSHLDTQLIYALNISLPFTSYTHKSLTHPQLERMMFTAIHPATDSRPKSTSEGGKTLIGSSSAPCPSWEATACMPEARHTQLLSPDKTTC